MDSPYEFLENPSFPDPRGVGEFCQEHLPEIVGEDDSLDQSSEREAFKLAQQRVYYYIHQAQARLEACGADVEKRRVQLAALDKILAERDALDNLAVRFGIVTDLNCDEKRVRQLWFTSPPDKGETPFPVRLRQVANVKLIQKESDQ